MLIGRQFILHLNGMLGQVAYLPFAVAPQCFANARKHRRNDAVKEVVAAHIEISGLRCQSQRKQTLHERFVSVASLRENLLQTTDFRIYAVAQRLQRLFGMVEIEAFDENDVEKIEHGECGVAPVAVSPDVPYEKRPDNFRILLEKRFEIEDAAVVERGHHTHVLERRGITLEVLNGINISVEHKRVSTHLPRSFRCFALHQIIIVGIHTGNHGRAEAVAQIVHQCDFLSLAQRGARREHHFKIIVRRFQRAQERAPEKDIVVAFHVSHDFMACLLRSQPVGGRDEVGIKIL